MLSSALGAFQIVRHQIAFFNLKRFSHLLLGNAAQPVEVNNPDRGNLGILWRLQQEGDKNEPKHNQDMFTILKINDSSEIESLADHLPRNIPQARRGLSVQRMRMPSGEWFFGNGRLGFLAIFQ